MPVAVRPAGLLPLAAVLALPLLAPAAGPVGPADAEQTYDPPIAPASAEGENALAGFTLPDGVTGRVWAAEPLLANPVAIDVDHAGRLFVCETFRQQNGVEDNRNHMDWLRADLAATTVEDRAAYIRAFVEDAETLYTAEQDRVRLVTDTDGDGTGDAATVFAGGFNTLVSGTGAGVLARPGRDGQGGTVYYACIPDLWRLRDADGDGVAERRESLATGFGVRFAFRGHDMHGLTLGPDGRLYWSIGDRGFNVTTREGERLVKPDTGAVFRSELDGSNLEVFAHGLRNPQELAFDDAGNLFTWDNNSDSGDHARWVHVLQQADSGWRMYYQYLPDRGPWNREMTWFPAGWEPGDGTAAPPAEDRSGDPATATGVPQDTPAAAVRPAFAFPPLANIGDGPSGLAFDPGVGLPRELRGHFFACDFRGTPGQSGIRHWANDRDGATFKLVDPGRSVWGVLATDVTFGPDGGMFVSDWVTGWDGVGKGRVYRFDHGQTDGADGAAVLAAGFDDLGESRLAELLNHADRRVRQEAQLALADRGAADSLLAVAEDATADPYARRHALWGLGICVRKGGADAAELVPFAADEDPVLRWWAVRLLGELAPRDYAEVITAALRDADPRVVREAALAATEPLAGGWLREVLARFPDDPAIFHAAAVGLSNTLPPAELTAHLGAAYASRPGMSDEEVTALNERQHLAAVVALRRLGAWGRLAAAVQIAKVRGGKPLVELARAVLDEPATAASIPALKNVAELNDPHAPPLGDPLTRRVLMANFLLGGEAHAARAAALAADPAAPAELREEALAELLLWEAPDRLDRVTGRLRPAAEWAAVSDRNRVTGDGEIARDAGFLRGLLPRYATGLLDGPPAVTVAALALLAKHVVNSALPAVRQLAVSGDAAPKVRAAAINATDALADAELSAAVARRALTAKNAAVRAAGRAVLVRRDPAGAVGSLSEALETGETLERQAAVAALAGLRSPEADAALKVWLDRLIADDAPPEIALELLEAAGTRDDGGLGKYLSMYEDRRGPDKLDAWSESLTGGDAEAGKELFFGRSAASCRRCHMAEGSGGLVGPNLDGIGAKRDRRYLLESIVQPSAKIAEGFATAVVLTDDGQVRTGVLKADTDDAVTLVLPTGEELVIPAETVLDRTDGPSAMPADIPDALTKREMRDLVEYLATLTEPAVAGDGARGHE